MKQNYEYIDIPYIARFLKMRKSLHHGTVLVLGSQAGGLFRSEKFYETLKPFAEPGFKALPYIQQFEQCYHLLTRKTQLGLSATDIDQILIDALKNIDVSDADISLAKLVKLGFFDTIVTTNIDTLLEKSFTEVGMKELHDFEVHSIEVGFKKEDLRSPNKVNCRIIKIFGQITSKKYAKNRFEYIRQNKYIRDLLEETLSRDCTVVGLDRIWDAEIYQAFPFQGDPFWFISEVALSTDTSLYQIGEARNARYFEGKFACYEYFMQALYSTLMEEINVDEQQINSANSNGNPEIDQQKTVDSSLMIPPTKNTIAVSSSSGKVLKVFLSYVFEDEFLVSKLIEHMATLKQEGIISEWYNRKIQAGQVSIEEIDDHLKNADIVLLMVSASFIASNYISSVELKRAIELHQARKARVIPVILRPVDWKGTPFGTLEPLPSYGKPVTRWNNRDSALLNAVEGIRKIAQELRKGP